MSQEELSQMGSSKVYLTDHLGIRCIRKKNTSLVELVFYQQIAPVLREQGVNIPELIDINENDLFIEYIPRKITLCDLCKKAEMYKQLAIIHNCSLPYLKCLKTHSWTNEQTKRALAILNLPKSSEDTLIRVCQQSSILFQLNNYISGDTNDGNWGIRENNELVLFDWERFGKGSPAIDLAPLVKGMGNKDAYTDIIEHYTKYNPNLNATELFKHIIISKAWLVVEVTNLLTERNNSMSNKYVKWYNKNLPAWFDEIKVFF